MEVYEDDGDVVMEYVYTLDKPPCHGHSYWNVHGDIWIVLESRHEKRNRYLGWFFVEKEKTLDNPSYVYVGEFLGKHLWRLKDDFLPE